MQFEQACEFILNKLYRELPASLTYHSVDHVREVYHSAERIGKQEGIADDELKLLLTAACYHDAGFLVGGQGHEEESCRMVKAVLPDYGYTPDDIEQICRIIMATKIPQSPSSHLGQILADADLDYLGRDDFFLISGKLYKEFALSGLVNTEAEWNRLQAGFLESHHYFTQTALNLRQAKKEQHLAEIKAKLNNNPS